MTREPPLPVVSDAGPVIHLDELGALDLLVDVGHILVPASVWAEIERYRPGVLSKPATGFTRVEVSEPPSAELQAVIRSFSLDRGEADGLVLMETEPSRLFLTDDAAARLAASHLGHEVHGTVGIIVRALRRRLRSAEEVVSLLGDIPARSSLHIKAESCSRR